MKAAQIMSFGAPDVLQVTETDHPTPAAGEVLVSVEASSVNGHDTIVRAGGLKMVSGRTFPIGIGLDFAGTVAAKVIQPARMRPDRARDVLHWTSHWVHLTSTPQLR